MASSFAGPVRCYTNSRDTNIFIKGGGEGRKGGNLGGGKGPVAAMCSYVCSAPCERACRRGDIDRPLAIRAMKRFLVEWHEASGIPDVMP